jgi:hypothetical protein
MSKNINYMLLPEDLCDKILSYKYGLDHRLELNNILYSIRKEAAIKRFSFINHDPFDIIMDREEAKNMIKILEKCNCCSRHMINKPGISEFENMYVPSYSTNNKYCIESEQLHNEDITLYSIRTKCNCKCRFTTRHICRLMNDEEWTSDEENSVGSIS